MPQANEDTAVPDPVSKLLVVLVVTDLHLR